MAVLGVVAGRGGSKQFPGKNLALLGGRPLVAWSVRAASAARTLTETLVSTDDDAIARAAEAAGGAVPFRRPVELARDDTGVVEVLQHAVRWWEAARKDKADVVVLLQVTSPLRLPADIDETVRLLLDSGCDSAQTVALDETHPYHRFRRGPEGRLEPMFPEAEGIKRRQDSPQVYKPTGAVYAVRRATLMDAGRLHGADRRGLVRGLEVSVDVDAEADLALARWYLEQDPGRWPAS